MQAYGRAGQSKKRELKTVNRNRGLHKAVKSNKQEGLPT